jgi:hypothetical protein
MDKTARSLLVCACLLLIGCGELVSAQPRQPISQAKIRDLINELENPNEFIVLDASKKLIRIGARVIPPVMERMKQNKNCDFQYYAADLIRQIDPRQEIVKSTLINVARFDCIAAPGMHSALVNVIATSLLVEKVKGGIPLVAQWLRGDDESLRGSAAIAFDSLAELIQKKRLVRARSQEIISATRAAIPMLAKALDDEDKIVRCRSYAALWRMQQSGYKYLRADANRALQGITDRCA